jgi:hypothetical protein
VELAKRPGPDVSVYDRAGRSLKQKHASASPTGALRHEPQVPKRRRSRPGGGSNGLRQTATARSVGHGAKSDGLGARLVYIAHILFWHSISPDNANTERFSFRDQGHVNWDCYMCKNTSPAVVCVRSRVRHLFVWLTRLMSSPESVGALIANATGQHGNHPLGQSTRGRVERAGDCISRSGSGPSTLGGNAAGRMQADIRRRMCLPIAG